VAGQIQAIKDLEGKTVGVSALSNADHALALFLLKQANADASKVKFATMGVNLLEALRQGRSMPASCRSGLDAPPEIGRARARQRHGPRRCAPVSRRAYEFMGVAVRGKELEQRRPEMVELTRALTDALKAMRTMGGDQLVAALPGDDDRARSQAVRRDHRAPP